MWVGLSLPTTLIELATGFLYGPYWGCACSLFCKTMGQLIAFLVVIVLRRRLGWQVPEALKPRLQALRRTPLLTMLGVRLTPFPLGLKNYGLALCEVSFLPYMIAGIVVNIPFSALWAVTGSSCHSLREAMAFDVSQGSGQRASWAAGAGVLALLLVCAAWKRLRRKTAGSKSPLDGQP